MKCTQEVTICGTRCEVDFYHHPYRPMAWYPYPGHPEEPEEFEIMELRVNGVDVLDLIEDLSTGGIDFDKIIEAIKEEERIIRAINEEER